MAEWVVLIKDVHPGYISWAQYEHHLQQLKQNSQTYGHDRRRSPPREGPALLQGLIICGRCGERMTLRYSTRKDGRQVPDYMCQKDGIEHATELCQRVPGGDIDERVSQLIVDSVTPLTIDVALEVQRELESRANEVIQLHQQGVERARYDADLARARFIRVDPANRLVADTLEAEWNQKLNELDVIQAEHEQVARKEQYRLSEQKRQELLQLASDFPRLWNDPQTTNKERKRIVRLIIEDVTITRGADIEVAIRFKGGAIEILHVPPPLPYWAARMTEKEVIREIDQLLDSYTPAQIADILNREGKVTGTGLPFTRPIVHRLRMTHKLTSRRTRMLKQGYISARQLGHKLGVFPTTIADWAREGFMPHYTDGKNRLYRVPDMSLIDNLKKRSKQGRSTQFITTLAQRLAEVQYEV